MFGPPVVPGVKVTFFKLIHQLLRGEEKKSFFGDDSILSILHMKVAAGSGYSKHNKDFGPTMYTAPPPPVAVTRLRLPPPSVAKQG